VIVSSCFVLDGIERGAWRLVVDCSVLIVLILNHVYLFSSLYRIVIVIVIARVVL
jgi:hypothetical protein